MKIGLTLHMDADVIPDVVVRYHEQLDLVLLAEQVGLDCIWLTEHHGQIDSPTPRPELFIAHATACTQRIKFGTAALLLGQRAPLEIAEIISMLSVLAPQRIQIGLAKGGPFIAHQHIWAASAQRGERLLAALPVLRDWLDGRRVVLIEGGQAVPLVPYFPQLAHTPLFVATRDPAAITQAAKLGLGLMAAQFSPVAGIRTSVAQYTAEAGKSPRLMVGRGVLIDDDESRACLRALAHVNQVRARKHAAKRGGLSSPPQPSINDATLPRGIDKITRDNIDEFALIGSVATIRARLPELAALGVTDLALNPMTDDTSERREQLMFIGQLLRQYGQFND
jgi:alkanesulfonate monooxygenase SsuD/methylene tetrahydromethanopterin reductase-like flavin-dependent oxidoreductase (luciferase family)